MSRMSSRIGRLWWCLLQLSSVIALNRECTEQRHGCMEGAETPAILHHGAPMPGFRAAITSKGLSYLNALLIPLLKQELTKLVIPEISGKADIKVGKVKYKFKRIHLTEVTIGSSSLESDSSTGLILKVSDISLTVEGDWWYKLLWSDDGSVKMRADGASLAVSMLLGSSAEGQPSLTSTTCTFRAGDVSVKFKGGASWLLNLFQGFVEGKIKEMLNSKVCEMVSGNIRSAVDKSLLSFPVTVPIDSVTKLSYALIKEPSFEPGMIVTDHRGEFFSEGQRCSDVPFSPSPLPSAIASLPMTESESRMIHLWVTDYIFNSAALVYMRAGYFSYRITPDMVGGSESLFQLNTNSFAHVIPKLYDAYPNQPVILGFRNTDIPPAMKITPQGAKLTIPGALDFYVIDDTTLTFTLAIMVVVDIQPWIETRSEDNLLVIKSNATNLDTELSVLASNIGDFGEEKEVLDILNGIAVLCRVILLPPINRFTNKGFPIPVVNGVTFQNPVLSLGEGYVLIETDFSNKQ